MDTNKVLALVLVDRCLWGFISNFKFASIQLALLNLDFYALALHVLTIHNPLLVILKVVN
jgi:hypothetical protein